MYFPRGGSTLKGVSRPGEIVWSRIYVERGGGGLAMDIGRGGVVKLSDDETQRRWQATTPQWPIMHAVLYGVDRDQLMARHKANHIHVVYAPDAATARRALVRKAAHGARHGHRRAPLRQSRRLARPQQPARLSTSCRDVRRLSPPLLSARHISKEFPGVRALDDVGVRPPRRARYTR